MPGSVASGTLCILIARAHTWLYVMHIVLYWNLYVYVYAQPDDGKFQKPQHLAAVKYKLIFSDKNLFSNSFNIIGNSYVLSVMLPVKIWPVKL